MHPGDMVHPGGHTEAHPGGQNSDRLGELVLGHEVLVVDQANPSAANSPTAGNYDGGHATKEDAIDAARSNLAAVYIEAEQRPQHPQAA